MEATPQELQTADALARVIERGLPAGWGASIDREVPLGHARADLVATVTSPAGEVVTLVIELKSRVDRRDVSGLVHQLTVLTRDQPDAVGVVGATYLPPTVREELTARGLSYADTTGNLSLHSMRPGLLIRDRGADSDPTRGPGRPRGTLQGAPATKVVRALLDLPGPWRVRDLVEAAGASTGATYRVLDYLEREALVERPARGLVSVPSWRPLLEAWSRDYGFLRSHTVRSYIEPRGLPAFLAHVAAAPSREYAMTGSVAAATWAPYAPARTAMVFVRDAAAAAAEWGLRPTETGANVLLAEPPSSAEIDRALSSGGLVIARPTQVAADLLTAPGRGPEEAVELLNWMEDHEPEWRR